jgi:hypothetical protein
MQTFATESIGLMLFEAKLRKLKQPQNALRQQKMR